MDISIVVPLFNEEESLPELEAWIRRVMEAHHFSYEILFVDDGSRDGSWDVVVRLAQEQPTVRGIKFRRNYGKSAALNRGFAAVKGDVVITMDADLQDSPEEVPELYRMITEEGFDMVSGWKRKRYDPVLTKNLPSKFFNWTARQMTGIHLHDFNCGLKAYRQAVVKSIEVYGDMHRYIPVLAKWAGFKKIGEKVVQHQERKYGTTKFGIERFIRGPLDLLSVVFISKFGKRPMHFFGMWGAAIFVLGFLSAGYIGVSKLYRLSQKLPTILVTDNPYFYISLTCMIIGTMLFLSGFLAELVSRTATDRNNYLIEKEIGGG
ncbi:glycosyltransferase family 2 protein [Phaeodactylibacter luteus]|uniref:Glycosyltransferase family 2 protein n=1 Tax=Phaeodactylibacter luteus TaxID=1564516 RepID=A0A5C6RKQ4_9BACT|nr:glycosyltransferase family 2 protein [Phaeodactylibacter luteus]TXB62823.1 glycosyltransferase family 2 protein [Phaeodactylibacter luteus]